MLGHFDLRHPFILREQQSFAVNGREIFHDFTDVRGQYVAQLRFLTLHGFRFCPVLGRALLPVPFGWPQCPKVVSHYVSSDLENPSHYPSMIFYTWQLFEHLDENFLGEIVGHRVVANPSADETPHRVPKLHDLFLRGNESRWKFQGPGKDHRHEDGETYEGRKL